MFNKIKEKVSLQYKAMAYEATILQVDLVKDELFNEYLNALPEDQKQYHNCNCCKSFLNKLGGVIAIKDGIVRTIWDFSIEGIYSEVPKRLRELVLSKEVKGQFLTTHREVGTDYNYKDTGNEVIKYEHFYEEVALVAVVDGHDIGKRRNFAVTRQQLLKKALTTISVEAVEALLLLISDNNLYRGSEHESKLEGLHEALVNSEGKSLELFCWEHFNKPYARMVNSSIGELLVNLSSGMDTEVAIKKYEAMVAPSNYKRPKSIVTSTQVLLAIEALQESGLANRRQATKHDIPIVEMLYTSRLQKEPSITDMLLQEVAIDTEKLRPTKIKIEDFISEVLPTTKDIRLILENEHRPNLVTLVAPETKEASNIFTWDNGVSWSYAGGVADSMKDAVYKAGGNVKAVLRVSLMWNEEGTNNVDLDIHCKEPDGTHIYYGNKGRRHESTAMLDIDVINPQGKVAVENITWVDETLMQDGMYKVWVNNYSEGIPSGGKIKVEVDYKGMLYNFVYDKKVPGKGNVHIIDFIINNGELSISESLPLSKLEQTTIGGLKTLTEHKVTTLLLSPNYWGNNEVGNKHYIFTLENAKFGEAPRPFYNEFLVPELAKHRRVFETLAGKLKVTPTEEEVTGVGFNSTTRNKVICKVADINDKVTIYNINF